MKLDWERARYEQHSHAEHHGFDSGVKPQGYDASAKQNAHAVAT